MFPLSGAKDEEDEDETITPQHLLQAIEEAYPNSLMLEDMSRYYCLRKAKLCEQTPDLEPVSNFRRFKLEKEIVKTMVMELVERQLVKTVGVNGVPGEGLHVFSTLCSYDLFSQKLTPTLQLIDGYIKMKNRYYFHVKIVVAFPHLPYLLAGYDC